MYLLLIPDRFFGASLEECKSVYGSGLKDVLSLAKSNSVRSLDIVLVGGESLSDLSSVPRGQRFSNLQPAINHLYSLLALLLVEQDSDASDDTVDIQVYITYADNRAKQDRATGPILAFHTMATASRPWTDVFTWNDGFGDQSLKEFKHERRLFLELRQEFQEHKLPYPNNSGPAMGSIADNLSSQPSPPRKSHNSIAVGGTFDHLHLGHKLLLTATALVLDPYKDHPRTLTIGITTTSLLLNKAHASVLESWTTRQASVITFLTSILTMSISSPAALQSKTYIEDAQQGTAIHYFFPGNLTVRCVEIDNAYGPTITDPEIDALVVSAETRKGGEAVNTKRREKGWTTLDVFEVDVLDSAGGGDDDASGEERQSSEWQSKISSTEIRRRILERTQAG